MRTYRITQRQREALHWLSLGFTTTGVARQLGVKPSTARTLLKHVYRRFEVHSAAEAVRVGFETGLLEPRVDVRGEVARRYAARRGQPAPPDRGVPGPDTA